MNWISPFNYQIMEFDENIGKLHGTLYSLGIQELLNKSSSLQNVVSALKKVISCLSHDGKSKLTFFLVLNSRLSVSEKLKNDEIVGLLTNITPYIEKDYLVTYIYHLNLQSYLFAIIEDCPNALGVELLDVIIKKLNETDFHRNDFGTEHLYKLWQSVFRKICKIEKLIYSSCCLEKFLSYFQDIYNLIQKIIVRSMTLQGLEKFIGDHLYNFFNTLLICIRSVKETNLPENPIYQLSSCLELNLEATHKCDITNPTNVCVKMIFNEMFIILQNLTVDIWLTLSECYLDAHSRDSAQFLIGDLVYCILEEVKPFHVPIEVFNCLSSLAINKAEMRAKLEIEEIISNINNNERGWLEVLVKHPGFIQQKSINCLIDHLHLADVKELSVILNFSYKYLCSCEVDENLDLIKKLFLAAIKESPDCSQWLQKIFEKYQPNLLKTAQTNDEVIKAFNRISKEKNMLCCDLSSLCMQSPFETIKRICHIAINGTQQLEFVVELLKQLRHPCSVSIFKDFTLLDYILLKFLKEEFSEKERQLFINLVLQLAKQNLLGSAFSKNLLKSLKEYLEKEMFEKATISLAVTKGLLDEKLFSVDKTAFLVFMCQVLEHLTWDLKNFSNVKAEGRELAVWILSTTINRLKLEESESDLQWARQEILKAWEGNQAHFGGLWPRFHRMNSRKFFSIILSLFSHSKEDDVRKRLTGVDQPSEIRASIILSLFLLLPVLSFREWRLIFDRLKLLLESVKSGHAEEDFCLDVLDMFASSVLLLTLNLKRKDDIFPCYKYCLRNFMRLAKLRCTEMNEASLLRTFERIIHFLEMIEDKEKRKHCWEISSSMLVELIGLLKKQNVTKSQGNQIRDLLQLMDLKDTDALLKVLN